MAKVTATAFNAVRDKISSVIGSPNGGTANLGYNLAVTSTPVSSGSKVFGNDLNRVIQDINLAFEHQTGSATNLSTVPAKKQIETNDLLEVSTKVDIAFNSRTTAGVGRLSVVNSDGYSNGTPWASSHTYRTRFDWGSNANFRGWANLGGFITIGCAMSGGSGSSQDQSWINLFTSIGTLVFGGEAFAQQNQTRNGTFPNGGLYNLLGIGQSGVNASQGFKILAAESSYNSNRFILYIYPYGGTNTFNCTGFEMYFELLDPHTATGMGPDVVDSTFGISINTYYAYGKTPAVTVLGSTLG